jgi:ABC-type antimicrobial peptide transport system permease subunit
MVMRQGLVVTTAGIVIGSGLAYMAAQALAGGLYGISALDPIAWSSAIAAMLGSAALANFIPARRASLVDPSLALRSE